PTHEATPPREASKPAPARGPSKPAPQSKPAPAHGPSKPLPAKKPATARPAQPRPAPQAKPATPPKPRPIAKPAPIARPAPAPRPAPEAPPSVPTTTQLVVPVRVAFADAVARIDALVLRSAKQDWRTVSDPKAPTRVEVRYTAWRDPIEATYDDRTLRVGVTVRYAADVRASAKNPLGGGRIWITRGESWGTKSKPQVIAAKFHAVFTVQDDLSVKAEVALDGIDHGEAPSGDVCVKAIAQLCVSKGSIAPMVRRNLERQ